MMHSQKLTKGLVGIDSHVVELESRLDVGSNDVRFIGIWAMGGMGKTTLAWVVIIWFLKILKLAILLRMLGKILKKMVLFRYNKKLLIKF